MNPYPPVIILRTQTIMKAFHYLSLFLLLPLLFASCLDEEENRAGVVSIQLVAPEGYPDFDFDGMTVTLTSQSGQGTTYTSPSSPTGLTKFNVEYGEYAATVHHQTVAGIVFNGRVESILLIPEKENATEAIKLPLSQAQTNALVIKEIYYGGCLDKEGEWYNSDQYVTLYNNSDEMIYLDGLCVAMVNPTTNQTQSPWMKENPDMKLIPVHDYTWQFPGNGTDHPLNPRTSTTIATNAVNHTGGEYGHPGSVDLSKVNWAFWDEGLPKQAVPAPGVVPMKLLWRINPLGTRYTLSAAGPALMVFSLPGIESAETYVKDPNHNRPQPGANLQGLKYLMVPREWVIDCVDCVENALQVSNCRVPATLNLRPAYLPQGWYKGASLVRRQRTTADGHIAYQDTNNAAEDLVVSTPLLKGH